MSDVIALTKTKKDADLKLRKSIDDLALHVFALANFDNKIFRWKISVSSVHNQLSELADFLPLEEKFNGDVIFTHGGSTCHVIIIQ